MFKTYIVIIKAQFPSSYSDTGVEIEILAKTKAEAIKKARKENSREFYYDRFNGKLTYKAEEAVL